MDRLNAVAAHLPFRLEDYDAVNRTFARWVEHSSDDDLKTVEVWLYCHVQRYVFTHLLPGPRRGGGEPERIIGEIFSHAREQFGTVTDPARFTYWVGKVCRNGLINGLRRPYRLVLADAALDGEIVPEPELTTPDRALVHHAVARAMDALPEAVQQVARMRFLENRSYHHIAAATGHPLPTVRTYAARAVHRLREDPGLRMLGQALDFAPP